MLNKLKIQSKIFKHVFKTFARKVKSKESIPESKEDLNLISKTYKDNLINDSELLKTYENIIKSQTPTTKQNISFEEHLKQVESNMQKIKMSNMNSFDKPSLNISESESILDKLEELKKNKMPLPYNIQRLKSIYESKNENNVQKQKPVNTNSQEIRNNKNIQGINTNINLNKNNLINSLESYESLEIKSSLGLENSAEFLKYKKDLSRHKLNSEIIEDESENKELLNDRDITNQVNLVNIKKEIQLENKEKDKKMDRFKRLVMKDVNTALFNIQQDLEVEKNLGRVNKMKGLGSGKNSLLIKKNHERLEQSKCKNIYIIFE